MANNAADEYNEIIYIDRLWDRADADQDGFLQKEEALQFLIELLLDSMQHVEDMKQAQVNSGKSSGPKADSVMAKIQKALEHVMGNGSDFVDKLFKVLDTDGDGMITRTEFMAGIPNLLSRTQRQPAELKESDSREYDVNISPEVLDGLEFSPGLEHKSCVVNDVFAPGSLNLLQKLSQVIAIDGESVENMSHEEVMKKMQHASSLREKGDGSVNITFRSNPKEQMEFFEQEQAFKYQMARAISMSKKESLTGLRSRAINLNEMQGDEVHHCFDRRPFHFSCRHSTYDIDGTELNAQLESVNPEMMKKGIKVGYHLTEVNGICTIGMPFDEICQLISGENLPVVICFADLKELPMENMALVDELNDLMNEQVLEREPSRWAHPEILSPSSRDLFVKNDARNLAELWDRVDSDHNGVINREELQDLITKYFVYVQQSVEERNEPIALEEVGEIIDTAWVELMGEMMELTSHTLEILIQKFKQNPDSLLDRICQRLDPHNDGKIDKWKFLEYGPDLLFRLETERVSKAVPPTSSMKRRLRDRLSARKTFVSLSDVT